MIKNIVCVSDIHFSHLQPSYRTDSIIEAGTKKLHKLFDLGCKHGLILNAGDLTHTSSSWDTYHHLINALTNYMQNNLLPFNLLSVYGQHDLYFRTRENTILYTLESLGLTRICFDKPYQVNKNVHIYGASYNEDIPRIFDADARNILVIHAPISGDKMPFETERLSEKKTSRKFKGFELVVCGDIHQKFHKKIGDTLFLNSGPLLRRKIDVVDHSPGAWIYNLALKTASWEDFNSQKPTINPEWSNKTIETFNSDGFIQAMKNASNMASGKTSAMTRFSESIQKDQDLFDKFSQIERDTSW